jgi:hypothetical protein
VADGIAHLRSYRQIIIHPRCVHFAQEAKLYSYKIDPRSGDVLPIIVDKHNHLIDSARYALDPLIKPKRRMGLDFVDDEGTKVCQRCESLLPDDGECPHCGWTVALEEVTDAESSDAEELVLTPAFIEEVIDLPRIDTRHAGANGNGHSNGNGNGNGHGKYSRLRGINDDD